MRSAMESDYLSIERYMNSVIFTFKALFLNLEHTDRFLTIHFNSAVDMLMGICTYIYWLISIWQLRGTQKHHQPSGNHRDSSKLAPWQCGCWSTHMKSVVTRWEPLAMALNSTPSRSMSLGRHHSSMFPVSPHCRERKHQNDINSTASIAEGKYVHDFFAEYRTGGVIQAGWISPSSLWRLVTAGQTKLGEERWGRGGDSARHILDHIHRLRYQWKGFLPWYEMLAGHTAPTGTQTDVCSWKAEGALVKSANRWGQWVHGEVILCNYTETELYEKG